VNQFFTGRAKYETDVEEEGGTLGLAAACQVEGSERVFRALLDCACPWCILPPAVAVLLGYDTEAAGDTRLHSRFGLTVGELIRLPIIFVAGEGEPLRVDATWFVSADWPGPMVIGWKGCLERMRFAFDPGANDFYFAAL
jgi:hypothetical protein